jgi:peptide/nickel transport system substrate-binding protein
MIARFCTLFASLLVLAGGCQWQNEDETEVTARALPTRAPAPDPLVVAVVGDPSTFNPIVADGQAGRAVGGAVFDTLVRLDPASAEARPNLAAEWRYDAARYEYTLALRDDVSWHDGRKFTARDVVFTIEAIHASPDSPYARILQIDGKPIRATAVGDHTIRFTLPRPYAPFLQSLVIPIVPARNFSDLDGEDELAAFAERWGTDSPPREIVGTGPFRIAAYEPGKHVVLQYNPTYWKRDAAGRPLPYLDRYVLRIAETREQARQWFLDGAIHIFSPQFDEVPTLRAAPSAGEFVVEEIGSDTGSLFLTFNRNPFHYRQGGKTDPRLDWFTDRRFLLAIAHAIDKRKIIDVALDGMGIAAQSLLPPANPFCDQQLEPYGFDPERARQILREAGYRDRNGDGQIEDAAGNAVEFSLTTNQGNAVRERIAELLIEQLAAIGMRATLDSLAFPDLFERLDATYNWDAMLIGFTGGIDPASSENLLRSSGELHVWHPLQQRPATRWEAEIDDLLDQGTRELDTGRRRDIYSEIQEILHDELPMIQLVRPNLYAARRNEVANFQPSPWGFHQIEELRLRETAAAKASKSG